MGLYLIETRPSEDLEDEVKRLKRLLAVAVAIVIVMMIASCGSNNESSSVTVESLAQPTSYVPDTPVPEPEYRSDQLVELTGSFVMDGPELIFQTAGEGSLSVGYFLDHDQWSTVTDFMGYTHSEVPSAVIKGYLLDSGMLAICRAEELFTYKSLILDDCPLQ